LRIFVIQLEIFLFNGMMNMDMLGII